MEKLKTKNKNKGIQFDPLVWIAIVEKAKSSKMTRSKYLNMVLENLLINDPTLAASQMMRRRRELTEATIEMAEKSEDSL